MTGKVLIVDDEANVRMAMGRQLRKDFNIIAAAGGGEALKLLETNGPFALIVSDMRMPGMNGIQLLGEFAKHAPDTVRIMLTGCTDRQTAIDAVNEGSIFRFLTKPCPPETLVAAIRAGLGQYRRSREHKVLFNTLPDALYVFDMDMKLVKWNKAMETVTGLDSGDLQGKSFDLLFPGEGKTSVAAEIRSVFEKDVAAAETLMLTRNGPMPVLLSAATLKDEDGKVAGFVGGARDFTQQARVFEELRAAELRVRAVFDNTADAIIMFTNDEIVEMFNPAAEEMFGYSENEAVGRKIGDLIPKFPKPEAAINGAVREFSARRKDGSVLPLELATTRMWMNDQRRFVCVARDLGERKLNQSRLIQMSNLASLGDMAAGIAHELSQPLCIIRLSVDLLLDKVEEGSPSSEFLKGKLEQMSVQMTRAAAILERMRTFAGKSTEQAERIDLRNIVRGALGLIMEQMRFAEIEVVQNLPATCRKVMGNQAQLEQVMLNLLSNARDAIEERVKRMKNAKEERRITVSVVDDPSTDEVRIVVQDNGGGISQEVLDRVFDPFFTTKEVGRGMGMGLSTCYGVVTALGGFIEAGNVGGGAQFAIAFPAGDEQQDG